MDLQSEREKWASLVQTACGLGLACRRAVLASTSSAVALRDCVAGLRADLCRLSMPGGCREGLHGDTHTMHLNKIIKVFNAWKSATRDFVSERKELRKVTSMQICRSFVQLCVFCQPGPLLLFMSAAYV